MKKKLLMLPCIAAVAVATIAGTKGWDPNVSESSNLLLANAEALAKDEATPNQEKKLTTEVIDIDRAELVDTVYFSKYLNSPQIIKLETHKKCVIQEIYRLDVFEGKFYILDVKSNSLFVFDSKGRYIYNIGERGNGNKEYLQISDFSIDRQNKVVYIWDEGRGRALSFDTETGKYLSMINHGVNESQCYDMLFTKGKLYVNQSSSTSKNNKFMVKEIDIDSGEKKEELLNADVYNKGWNLPLRSKNSGFSMRGTSAPKYVGMFGTEILELTDSGIIPVFRVESKKLVSKDDVEYIARQYEKNGIYELDRLLKNNKIPGIFNYLELGNTIHFSFNEGDEEHTLLYDRTTHTSLIPKVFGDDYLLKDGLCFPELCYSDNSKVVAALQTDVIPIFVDYAVKSDKLNKTLNNYDELKELADNVESNPILFIYDFKNVEVLSNPEGTYEYPGCTKKAEIKASVQNRESIDVPEVIDSVFTQLVHNIEYLPLRGSETHIMPEASKIRFNNEHIYIWNKEQHCISVYSLDGGFLFSLAKRGKARGEYMEIASFTVDATHIYVVDNYKHEINIYDALSGTYKGNRKIPFVCWDIEYLSENRFLFSYLPHNRNSKINTNQKHAAVWLTDSTFQTILAEYLPYDKDYYEIVGKTTYFSKNEDGVNYSSFRGNGFLHFNDKDPETYDVSFSKPIPSRDDLTYGEVVEQGYTYLSETPCVTDKFIFMSVASHGIDETVIYSKTTKKCYMNDYSNTSFAVLPLISSYENKGVAYLADYCLYEELISDGFVQCSEDCENILKNGGACLLFYTFHDK